MLCGGVGLKGFERMRWLTVSMLRVHCNTKIWHTGVCEKKEEFVFCFLCIPPSPPQTMLRVAELDERKACAKKRNLVARRLAEPAIINIVYGGEGGMSISTRNGFLLFFANTGLKFASRVWMPTYSHKHQLAHACACVRTTKLHVYVAFVD